MHFLPRWMRPATKRVSRPAVASGSSVGAADETRRELLAISVRDVLSRQGIPSHWIAAESHPALLSARLRGMHLRLVLREWQPELLAYTVALQKAVRDRLIRLDPLAATWLSGISWKFEPVDDSICPGLPPLRNWKAADEQPPLPLTRASLEQLVAPERRSSAVDALVERNDFRPTEPMMP